jgi:hypothetical protein
MPSNRVVLQAVWYLLPGSHRGCPPNTRGKKALLRMHQACLAYPDTAKTARLSEVAIEKECSVKTCYQGSPSGAAHPALTRGRISRGRDLCKMCGCECGRSDIGSDKVVRLRPRTRILCAVGPDGFSGLCTGRRAQALNHHFAGFRDRICISKHTSRMMIV